jgi:predicted transcriptional regulator|tara:strand:+ start:132 stop:764 length:633 start_codon:yes stop_codon:yes gene_type:complete
MDKFSQDKLQENVKDVINNAHLGELNSKELVTTIHVGRAKVKLAPSIIVYQESAYWSATTLKPASNSVIMLFLSLSHFENYVGIDQLTIAEELGMTVRTVQKSIAELIKFNVIIKVSNPTDRRRSDYFINPFHSWKGSAMKRKAFIKNCKKDKQIKNQLSLFGNTEHAILEEDDLYRKLNTDKETKVFKTKIQDQPMYKPNTETLRKGRG